MVNPRHVLAAILLLGGCGNKSTGRDGLNITEVTLPAGQKILAETMLQQIDQMRGMMFRDTLAQDRGMLFIHADETNYPYWMYQVRIPLDIVWMNRARRIVEISANTPPCASKAAHECPTFGGHEKSHYVLELAGGAAASYQLKVGDQLIF